MDEEQIVVVPGEVLDELMKESKNANKKIILGPGIRKEGNLKISSKAGILRSKKTPDSFWIDSVQKRVILLLLI